MLIAQGFRGELNEVRWVRCFLRKASFFFFGQKSMNLGAIHIQVLPCSVLP